jgi:hypothetical protein
MPLVGPIALAPEVVPMDPIPLSASNLSCAGKILVSGVQSRWSDMDIGPLPIRADLPEALYALDLCPSKTSEANKQVSIIRDVNNLFRCSLLPGSQWDSICVHRKNCSLVGITKRENEVIS